MTKTSFLGVILISLSLIKSGFAADLPGLEESQPEQRLVKRRNELKRERLNHRADFSCYHFQSFDTAGLPDDDNAFSSATGCATQHNLNAMVENGRDLARGRGTRYSSGEKAARPVSDYLKSSNATAGTAPGETAAK